MPCPAVPSSATARPLQHSCDGFLLRPLPLRDVPFSNDGEEVPAEASTRPFDDDGYLGYDPRLPSQRYEGYAGFISDEDASALCCVPSLHAFPRCSRERESAFARLHWAPLFSSSPRMLPIRGVPAARRVRCRASSSDDAGVFGGDDVYGFYPWDPRNASAGRDGEMISRFA